MLDLRSAIKILKIGTPKLITATVQTLNSLVFQCVTASKMMQMEWQTM